MGKKQTLLGKPGEPIKPGYAILSAGTKSVDEEIKAGRRLDPKYVEKHSLEAPIDKGGMESLYEDLPGDYYDEFEDYINPDIMKGRAYDYKALQQMRFENQTLGQEIGHGLERIALNTIPSIIGGAASMLDIQGYWDAEHAANNAIVNWAADVKKTVDEEIAPIYTDPSGDTMDLTSSAWWASRGSGLVESVLSFAAQGAGVGKLFSLGAKAGIGAFRGKKLFDALQAVPGVTSGANAAKNIAQGAKTLTHAVMMNQSEAVIEASQVYRDTYENALKGDMSVEEAKRDAALAASTTMRLNRLNILLNLTSSKAFLSPSIGSRILHEAPETLLKKVGHESIQEAGEELINHVASKAGTAKGQHKEYTFSNAMKDMFSLEGMEAAFLGALGGSGQTAITHGLNSMSRGPGSMEVEGEDGTKTRISKNQFQRETYEKQQKVIDAMKEKGVKFSTAMQNTADFIQHEEAMYEAMKRGDVAEYERLNEQRLSHQVLQAASTGTVGVLQKMYEAEAAKPVEEVGEEHVQRAKQAVKDIIELERAWNNFEGHPNVSEIVMNRSDKMRNERIVSIMRTAATEANSELNNLATELAKKYKFKQNREVIYKNEGKETHRETKEEETPLIFNLHDLENNPGTTQENKEIYDKFLNEVKASPIYTKATAQQEELEKHLSAQTKIQEEFNIITSKDYQKNYQAEQAKIAKQKEDFASMMKSNSLADIESFMETYKDNEHLTALAKKRHQEVTENIQKEKEQKAKDLIKQNFINEALSFTAENIEDNLEAFIEKVENTDGISRIAKDEILNALHKHHAKLSGEEVEEEEEGGVTYDEDGNQIGGDLAELVGVNSAVNATFIPSDLPNPNNEKIDVEQEAGEAIKIALANQLNTLHILEDGTKEVTYTQVTSGHDTGAFLSREFIQTSQDGTIEREEITDELIEEHKNILRADAFQEKSQITLEVNENYEGDVYDPFSETKEKMPWSQRLEQIKALHGDNYKLSDDYIGSVPITMTDSNGNVIYMHETHWINSYNVKASEEDLEKDRQASLDARRTVIKQGKVTTKVDFKSNGHLLKTKDNKAVSVSEAMPDRNLILGVGKDGTLSTQQKVGKVKPTTIKNGRLYAMIPLNDGTHLPVPLERKPLSEETAETVFQLIKAYLSNDPKDPLVQSINKALNIDVLNLPELRKVLKQFVYLVDTDSLETMLSLKTDNIDSSVRMMAITGNSIEFGRPGVSDSLAGKNKKAVVISRNFQETGTAENKEKGRKENEQKLAKLRSAFLPQFLSNADKTTLTSSKNAKTIKIDKDGNVSTMLYSEYLKSAYQTNLFSINVGTEEKPEWVYTIQPTIKINTKFIVPSQKKTTTKKSAPKTSTTGTTTQTVPTQSTTNPVDTLVNDPLMGVAELESMLKDIEAGKTVQGFTADNVADALIIKKDQEAKTQTTTTTTTEETDLEDSSKFIGQETIIIGGIPVNLDEDIDDDDSDESIPTLDPETTEAISKETEIVVVKGLTPGEQSALLGYLSSQIIMAANKEGAGKVKTRVIFAEALGNLKKIHALYTQKNLPNKARKMQNIIEQYNKVIALTQAKLDLLGSGKFSVDLATLLDTEEELGGGLEKTLYTDDWAFTINSKHTASANLRKFFAAIPNMEEPGKIKYSVLGFPEYIPFDTVYDTLHRILVGLPADYNLMLEKLKSYEEKLPWINGVISALETASSEIQNEFTSDMNKHHISMNFVMWTKKGKDYRLENWSSNASAIEQKLREVWESNLKNPILGKSRLLDVNEDGEYIFNSEVADQIIAQAELWAKNPPSIKKENVLESQKALGEWLSYFGIELSDNTYNDLVMGKLNDKGKLGWTALFTNSNGLVNVLAKQLKVKKGLTLENAKLLNDSVVKKLAALEATNSISLFSSAFQAGKKTIYSYGNNNFFVNRIRELLKTDYEGNPENNELLNNLSKLSFTQDSVWLDHLSDNGDTGKQFRSHFNYSYLSLEALKKLFTSSQDNRKLNNLTEAEHEVIKLALFLNNASESGGKRKVNYFYQSMSDKSTMTLISALSYKLQLEYNEENEQFEVSEENLDLLYKALILPEIKRIQGKKTENVSGFEPNVFYFLPELNYGVKIDSGETEEDFLTFIINKGEVTQDIKKNVLYPFLQSVLNKLTTKKVANWAELGIGVNDKDSNYAFLNASYMTNVAMGTNKESKIRYAAMDFIFNSLIANAEMQKLFIGDPALYAKFKSKEKIAEALNIPIEELTKEQALRYNLENSYVNLGKRLAGEIAPGMELADSINNHYIQVFLEDQKIDSHNATDPIQKKYFDKIIDINNYKGIEGSDAQEYTTWEEHLYVLEKLGRISQKDKARVSALLEKGERLDDKDLKIVLQPIKPVYVGNVLDIDNNLDRRIYIKSSSFPLIPQLTSGLEIDKVRIALKKLQDENPGKTVRASFNTANKVGAPKKAVKIFNKDGSVVDNITIEDDTTLVLPRSNFRIQQDVPFKDEKNAVNIGTQESILLFVDMLDEIIDGTSTGKDLEQSYLKNYKELFEYNKENLSKKLGLIQDVETNLENDLFSIPENSIFDDYEDFLKESESLSIIKKQEKKTAFISTIGSKNYDRMEYINKHFQSIVSSLENIKEVSDILTIKCD